MLKQYLGVDLGTKTIGLAMSGGVIASPYTTLRFPENNFALGVQELVKVIRSEEVTDIVIGYPINMNNTIGERAEMVDQFIDLLVKSQPAIIIHKVDERWTTKMANNIMLEADLSREKRKKFKDSLAAQIILETFLQQQKNLK